jgi:hypothetical protein
MRLTLGLEGTGDGGLLANLEWALRSQEPAGAYTPIRRSAAGDRTDVAGPLGEELVLDLPEQARIASLVRLLVGWLSGRRRRGVSVVMGLNGARFTVTGTMSEADADQLSHRLTEIGGQDEPSTPRGDVPPQPQPNAPASRGPQGAQPFPQGYFGPPIEPGSTPPGPPFDEDDEW